MKLLRPFAALVAGAIFALVEPLQAAPGDLDTSFGTGGKVTTAFSSGAVCRGVALQSDGKIVVAGYVGTFPTADVAVARYTPAGVLDTSFGSGGKVTTDFSANQDQGLSVALQSDGKIVVAGLARFNSDYDIALVRYTSAGALDTSFGNGGRVNTSLGSGTDEAFSVLVQADGKILVAGITYASSASFDFNFAVVRYTSTGALDAGFGNGGKVSTDFGSTKDYANAIALQPDGKILVAGDFNYAATSSGDFALARYTTAGALDTSFGTGGKVITSINSRADTGRSVAVQSDGKILVAGSTTNNSQTDVALVRYTSAGGLDPTFGSGGIVTTDIGALNDLATSMVAQSDGRILVAGSANNNAQFALLRYTSTGAVDANFGNGGKVLTDFGGGAAAAHAMLQQADGKIVAAGYATLGSAQAFAVLRLKGDADASLSMLALSAGTLSPAFIGGIVDYTATVSNATNSVTLTPTLASTATGASVAVRINGGLFSNATSGQASGALPLAVGSNPIEVKVTSQDGATTKIYTVTVFRAGAAAVQTGVASSIGLRGATLAGVVNPNSAQTTVNFEYGPTTAYGATIAASPATLNGSEATPVSIALAGLNRGTTYHYRVVAVNSFGTVAGADRTFTTLADAPTVLTGAAGAITSGSALLTGSVNPNEVAATCYFEYGFTAGYGNRTQEQNAGAGGASVNIQETVAGLGAGLTYHFRLVAENQGGTTFGQDGTFTTAASGSSGVTAAPGVVTGGAAFVGLNGATLQGTANPNGGATTVRFQYGLDTNYGFNSSSQSVGDGSSAVNVVLPISGLSQATTYHYRLVGTNSLGTTFGDDATFSTANPLAPVAVVEPVTPVGATFATLRGSVNPNGVNTNAFFEYGLTPAFGSTAAVAIAPGSGTSPASVSAKVSGLEPEKEYHYRLVATSASGTAQSTSGTFTTVAAQAPVAADDYLYVSVQNAVLNVLANDVNSDTGETGTGLVFDGFKSQPQHGQVAGGPVINYDPDSSFQLSGDTFTYGVKSDANQTAIGTVYVRSFASYRDSYGGAISGGPANDGGLVTLDLSLSGFFTGQLRWQGKVYPLRSYLNGAGEAAITKAKIGTATGTDLVLTLRLQPIGLIFGELFDEQSSNTFFFTLRKALDGTVDAEPGIYTAHIDPPTDGSSALPEAAVLEPRGGPTPQAVRGFGFTLVRLAQQRSGRRSARFSGRMPDAAAFGNGSKVFGDRALINANMYRRGRTFGGNVLGESEFVGGQTLASVLEWVKKANTIGLYPNGFRNGVLLRGNRFRSPQGNPADLFLQNFGATLSLEIAAGDLDQPKTAQVQLTRRGAALVARVTQSELPKTTFKVTPSTGLFSGTFQHPQLKKPARYFGAFRKSEEEEKGRGSFTGVAQAGSVTVRWVE